MIPLVTALFSLIILLACGFLVAWPHKEKGFMVEFARPLAVVIGGAAPVVILWTKPSVVLDFLLIGIAFVLGTVVVLLAETGWQIVLKGRRGEIEDLIDPAQFNPLSLMDTSSTPLTRFDDSGGCLLAAVFAAMGALVILGLYLTAGIKRLLPGGRTVGGRSARAVLSFGCALVVFVFVVVVMSSLHNAGAREPADQPAMPLTPAPSGQIVISPIG